MKLAAVVATITVLGLAGCANVPSESALQQANFGDEPDRNHRDRIRVAFRELLIDPSSARFKFGEPEQGWGRDDNGFVYGWVVWTEVDSKNQFGAYTGWKTYKVLLRNGEVDSVYEPAGDDMFGNPEFKRLR